MSEYLSDPEAIYRQSFAAIEAEADFARVPDSARALAKRLVHACGMPEIVPDLVVNGDPAVAGIAALENGAAVLADCAMVQAGVVRRRLPAHNPVLCLLDDPRVTWLAAAHATTRSAAAVELWRERLGGAIVAIGNAPTALFRLIEILEEGAPAPAAIFAFPVGFVGAAESKEALIARVTGPYVTLRGRRGGSSLAAAAVNALTMGEGAP
ncbi:MAG: precorrin-8X methylmutase [Rhodospirillales bacterium]|nr:precorrin-8X methylmutase [Rhodospirillales bacterium]